MKATEKRRYKAYKLTLTAITVGEDESDAFQKLLGALSVDPEDVIDEDISYEEIDIALSVSGDSVAEA